MKYTIFAVAVGLFIVQIYTHKVLERRVDQIEKGYVEILNHIIASSRRSHWHSNDGTVHWKYDYPQCGQETWIGQFCSKIGDEATYIKMSDDSFVRCDEDCMQKIMDKD